MEIAENDRPSEASGPGPVTVVGPTLALDLDWTAHAGWKPSLRDAHPVLGALDPDLYGRVRAFWGDGTECLPELGVLAQCGDALHLTDLDALLDAVGMATATAPADMRLASETAADRVAILDRLAVLRVDRVRRADYFDLLRQLWAPVDGWWQDQGAPVAAAATDRVRRDVDRGLPWQQQMTTEGCDLAVDVLPRMEQFHQAGQPVVLAVCSLFGKLLYLDLPDCMLVGVGAARTGSRLRAEPVARRLRVLADPTRLAILDHLAHGPASVGDLARAFGLAQPTVSAHVKQLRDAALVTAQRRGARLELSVDRTAVAALAGDLSSLVDE